MGSPNSPQNGLDRTHLSSDEVSCLRLTPTPAENYRCPVSTPSNYVQRHGRVVRRTKPLDDIFSQPTTAGRSNQSRATAFSLSRSSKRSGNNSRWTPKNGRSFDYYFVDKTSDKKEAEQTNTQWLQALCSQPVNEILNKYRRKTDVKRTRVIWSKTFSTPGEKSLLNAWENNVLRPRTKGIQSAIVGGNRRPFNSSRNLRQTQSEPPFSSTPFDEVPSKYHDDENISVHSNDRFEESTHPSTPVQDYGQMDKETLYSHHLENIDHDVPEIPLGCSPRNGRGALLEFSTGVSPRVTSYTTQCFKRFGRKGNVSTYTKVITGPEHLPRLSTRHKMSTLLHPPHYHYAPKNPENSPTPPKYPEMEVVPNSSQRHNSSPIQEEEEKERIHEPSVVEVAR